VLAESARAEIDADARAQIDRAMAFMEKQAFPRPETALEDLYA
jgi:TPP-dependent pyruvate/acetoin dehydrogenase alpha subunit